MLKTFVGIGPCTLAVVNKMQFLLQIILQVHKQEEPLEYRMAESAIEVWETHHDAMIIKMKDLMWDPDR